MKKILLSLIAGIALGSPVAAFAAGLGGVKTFSYLNEPLKAEIAVLSVKDKSGVKVALAPNSEFIKHGVQRSDVLDGLSFALFEKNRRLYVRVSSKKRITTPYLNFILQLRSPAGIVSREYAIFLDPKSISLGKKNYAKSNQRTQKNKSPYQRQSVQSVASPQISRSSGGKRYGPVRKGETLWSIANFTRPSRAVPVREMLAAIKSVNPALQSGGLKAGTTLVIPQLEGYKAYTGGYAPLPNSSVKSSVKKQSAIKKQPSVKKQSTAKKPVQPPAKAETAAEAAKAEAAKVETAKVETAKVEAAKVEAAKAETAKAETAKAEAAKAEAAEAEVVEAATAEAEADKAEVAEAEVAKAEAAKAEAAKAEATEAEATEAEATEAEATEAEAAKAEAAKAEAAKAEAAEAEAAKAEAAKAEAAKALAAKVKAARAEAAKAQATKAESGIIDWIMNNIPIIGGGIAAFLLAGLLVFRKIRQKKSDEAVVLLDEEAMDEITQDDEVGEFAETAEQDALFGEAENNSDSIAEGADDSWFNKLDDFDLNDKASESSQDNETNLSEDYTEEEPWFSEELGSDDAPQEVETAITENDDIVGDLLTDDSQVDSPLADDFVEDDDDLSDANSIAFDLSEDSNHLTNDADTIFSSDDEKDAFSLNDDLVFSVDEETNDDKADDGMLDFNLDDEATDGMLDFNLNDEQDDAPSIVQNDVVADNAEDIILDEISNVTTDTLDEADDDWLTLDTQPTNEENTHEEDSHFDMSVDLANVDDVDNDILPLDLGNNSLENNADVIESVTEVDTHSAQVLEDTLEVVGDDDIGRVISPETEARLKMKLDLADSYKAIANTERAKTLLQEVIDEGTEEQIARAQKALASID